MNNSQRKRIETLQKRGLYHIPNIVKCTCKQCGVMFEYDSGRKQLPKYYLNGFCSNKCYIASGQKKLDKMMQTLDNNNIPYTSVEDAIVKFSTYQSNLNKKCAKKWKETMCERYGKNFASNRSKLGWESSKRNFLIVNGIVSKEEVASMEENEVNTLFKDNFNLITNHGTKIKQGRLKKHHNNLDEYKESYKKALVVKVENYMTKEYGESFLENLNDDEYKTLFDECNTYLNITKKRGPKSKESLLKWKKSHLINHGMDKKTVDNLTEDEINEHYRIYYINRTNKLPDSIHNGYRHTKKGWFNFTKWPEFFFRSSWEERVCELLEELNEIISDVKTPEPIMYEFEGLTHQYFCDFEINFKNNKTLYVEVKPNKKTTLPINEAKFKSAITKFGTQFMIATEQEIFSPQLKEKLLMYYESN